MTLPEFKTIISDDFFREFIDTTDTGYFIWKKHPDIKAGNWAGDIISFVWKKLDEWEELKNVKRRKNNTTR